jgi:putative nucleotidyltransferase with HDIG domain
MFSPANRTRVFYAAELAVLAVTVAAALLISRPGEWRPTTLVVLLLAMAVSGQWFNVDIRGGQLGASMVAIVIAMGVLGPLPAALCGLAAGVVTGVLRRLRPADWITNLVLLASVPFLGALVVRLAGDHIPALHRHTLTANLSFGLVLFAACLLAISLTFFLFTIEVSLGSGRPLRRELRDLLPLLPGELAAGSLATILAVAYLGVGLSALFAGVLVLLVFQRLTVALLRSEDRAEALFARSRQLVGLQLGVLRTLVRALRMRDERTARHAAAVARYAKTLAADLGCTEQELDVIHAAGLLHDIGKFTWPDRVLHAAAITAEDLAMVREHPQEGAILVGALDGYGEVADAILYHHERIDGLGYPAGLIGREIPLGSRIIAVCSNYDTMTAPDSYRTPMPPEEAMAELQRSVVNGQLDAELVERFIAVLRREGTMFGQEADFETELDFERRVRQMAEPNAARTVR